MNEASRHTETGVHYHFQQRLGTAIYSDRPQHPPFVLMDREACGSASIGDGMVDSGHGRLPEYSDGIYSDPRLELIFGNMRGFLERTP